MRWTEAELVLTLRAAGCVYAEEEARLLLGEHSGPEALDERVSRRVGGEPLEVILGWADFCGLRIVVEPGVFVPRQRTEFLVRQAASFGRPGAVVVDLCCGTGAVGVALLAGLGHIELYAADLDPAAVHCARRNVRPPGQVLEGDLYSALPALLHGRVDLLVVNAPYVPTESIRLMPPEARLYEPRSALDGGSDGVDIHRRVANDARTWLAPGGHLLIETSDEQAELTRATMTEGGLLSRVVSSEELYATVVIGTPGP